MQIGISGANPFDDADELQELGVQWFKFAADIDGVKSPGNIRRIAEQCLSLGIRCVVDMRTTAAAIRDLSNALFAEDGERDIAGDVAKRFAEDVFVLVDRYKDVITDWEWWGEPDCPHVTQGTFKPFDYGQTLREVYRAAKQADNSCRVWTGGFGVNCDIGFLERVHAAHCEKCNRKIEAKRTVCPICGDALRPGNGSHYDVCNLHHYSHARALDTVIDYYHRQLNKLRELTGATRWIGSTEWGLPTAPEDGPPVWLKSHVLTQGVQTVFEPDAPDWFDAMFRLFEAHGMQVVCVHMLHDRVPSPAGHWGDYSGLSTRYAFGGRSILDKPRRKAHWETVQRWAHAGRDTEVFDETAQSH